MSEQAARASTLTIRNWPALLAGSLAVAGLSLTIVSLLLWGSQGFPRLPASFAQTTLAIIPGQVTAICYVAVGALLGARVPRNPVGWLLLGAGLAMSLILPITLLVDAAHQAFRPAPGGTLTLAWGMSSLGTPATVGMIAMAGLLFPDGRLVSPRWRPVAWLTIVSTVLLGLSAGLDPDGLLWFPTLPNELSAPRQLAPLLSVLEVAAIAMLLAAMTGLVASFAVRYRMGDVVMRAQLRWIEYAIVLQVLGTLPFILARYVITVSDATGELFVAVAEISSMALPIAAAMAITRRHLFGIDRLINRTIVYASLIGVLGGLYAAVVWLLQRLFVSVTGEISDAPLLFAVFLIAGAFTPVRKALDGMVDRWAHPATAGAGAAAAEEVAVAAGGEVPVAAAPPGGVAITAAPGGPPGLGLDDPEVLRVAAAVLALRRFELRFAAPVVAPPAAEGPVGAAAADVGFTTLAIDAAGCVPCPMSGSTIPVTTCLGCPSLRGLLVVPPVVRCGFAPTPARTGEA